MYPFNTKYNKRTKIKGESIDTWQTKATHLRTGAYTCAVLHFWRKCKTASGTISWFAYNIYLQTKRQVLICRLFVHTTKFRLQFGTQICRPVSNSWCTTWHDDTSTCNRRYTWQIQWYIHRTYGHLTKTQTTRKALGRQCVTMAISMWQSADLFAVTPDSSASFHSSAHSAKNLN